MSEMKGRELFGRCGLEVVEGQVPATLPAARQAVGITFGGTDPAAVVPLAAADLSDRVDEAWLRLAREHDVVDGAGRFLIATPMDGPWVPVRLCGEVRLAENLTGNHGKPGHAEFVTMALDGSVMCGVTTEDEEVWLVLDRDRIQQPPPPPPDMEAARAATRRLHESRRYAPERLRPPLQDGWVFLAFDRTTANLRRLYEIPDSMRDVIPARFGALDPGAVSEAAPLAEAETREIGERLDVLVDPEHFAYFLEFQQAHVKSAQSSRRTTDRGLLA